MIIRLRDRTTCPPNGFMFTDADGWESRKDAPESRWDFRQLAKAVIEHRRNNPQLNLTTDLANIESEVDSQNAYRVAAIDGAEQFIIRESSPVQYLDYFAGHPPMSSPHYATMEDVSAVIAIYKPKADTLNKCLNCVLNQANEIVVTLAKDGIIPDGALNHPKIRYVQMKASDVGYGRNANHGIRYSKGRYIWLLNDDVFPSPDCCEKLLEVLRQDNQIGMVGHELRYPDGTLQHGGTMRTAGAIGFPHIDTGMLESTIKHPVELESVTGASVVIRHAAFYHAGGFPESHYLYLEDSHLCLAMRQAGWKVYYTPHAKAEHMEHQSTCFIPKLDEHIKNSVKAFQSNWGWYFEKNLNNPGLGVFK